jgi:hypothetical protein
MTQKRIKQLNQEFETTSKEIQIPSDFIRLINRVKKAILLNNTFIALFVYSSALIILTFLMLGESLIETIIFNLLN